VKLPPFQTLLDAHGRDIFRFLAAAVGAQEAEDCFQETFLAALRSYPELRDASNLRGWLYTIAHSKVADHYRARRTTPIDRPVREEPGHEPDPTLWESVGGLPAKQRSAILLRYLDDLPYRVIGEAIGCSEAAARQNVRAGLARLRKELDDG